MPVLTIFTAPKPFTNAHIDLIQRNALQAWAQLTQVDVIVIGNEPGIADAAREFGVRHVAEVERDELGVPLVSSLFNIGHKLGRTPLLCYANADMILMSDLVRAGEQALSQANQFLLVGQRWNLDLTERFDYSGDWESRIRTQISQRGQFFTPWGIDYFLFPRDCYLRVPDFRIGRVGWDNWMVYHAVASIGLAIDATLDVLAVHQNHDYSHLPGNKSSHGTEAARINLDLAGGRRHICNVLDTNRELRNGRLVRPQLRLVRLLRRLERMLINDEGKGWGWELALRLQKMQKPLAVRRRR